MKWFIFFVQCLKLSLLVLLNAIPIGKKIQVLIINQSKVRGSFGGAYSGLHWRWSKLIAGIRDPNSAPSLKRQISVSQVPRKKDWAPFPRHPIHTPWKSYTTRSPPGENCSLFFKLRFPTSILSSHPQNLRQRERESPLLTASMPAF